MKVYKNFLEKKQIEDLKHVMMEAEQFPWFLSRVSNKEDLNPEATQNFQFTHSFYKSHRIQSNAFDLLTPIFLKIKPLSILRVKANLLTKTSKVVEHGMHVDYKTKAKIITGIFYVNTNNGYTKFENGKKIKSVENQYIEFDSQIKHTGATCTDQDCRVVINFNYVK